MFGILYMLGTLVGGAVSGVKGLVENEYLKENGKQKRLHGNNIANVYMDRNGVTRDIVTDRPAFGERDIVTGDLWVRHGTPSIRVRNISQEWRDQNYKHYFLYPETNRTVTIDINIPADAINLKKSLFNETPWKKEFSCYGQWYKDLKDGSLYVIRHFSTPSLFQVMNLTKKQHLYYLENYYDVEFYMDVHSRKFIRLSDDYIEKENKKDPNDRVPKEIIETIKTAWNNRIVSGYTSDFHDESAGSIYWDDYYFNRLDVIPSKRTMKEIDSMGKARPQRYAR